MFGLLFLGRAEEVVGKCALTPFKELQGSDSFILFPWSRSDSFKVDNLHQQGFVIHSEAAVPQMTDETFDRDLIEACPMYKGTMSCCHYNRSLLEEYFTNGGTPAKIKEGQGTRYSKIYPACDRLIKPFYCLSCHMNVKEMIQPVGSEFLLTTEANQMTIYKHNLYYKPRLCHSYAELIYHECKGVASSSSTWIVEQGMTLEDFKVRLGINGTTDDRPMENCWSFSAGFVRSAVSMSLLAAIGFVASLFMF